MNLESLKQQLKLAHAQAKREVEALAAALAAFSDEMKAHGKPKIAVKAASKPKGRRKLSASARARMSAAQKARWAKLKKKK